MNLTDILALPEVQQLQAEAKVLSDIRARLQAEKFSPDFELTVDLKDGAPAITFTPDPTGEDPILDQTYRKFLDEMSNIMLYKVQLKNKAIQKIIAEKQA